MHKKPQDFKTLAKMRKVMMRDFAARRQKREQCALLLFRLITNDQRRNQNRER